MEKLSPAQTQEALIRVAELLNYLVKEEIINEFDPSLISRLVGCHERLKIQRENNLEQQPTKHVKRLEKMIKNELQDILCDLERV